MTSAAPFYGAAFLRQNSGQNKWMIIMPVDGMMKAQPRGRSMDIRSIIIGVLAGTVIVLGYLLWEAQQTKVKVDLPGIKIEGR